MSEISNITVSQLASLQGYHIESKADEDKSETVPMFEHADITVEEFLLGGSAPENKPSKADSTGIDNFVEIENLVDNAMGKRLSDENGDTVGTVLATLGENIKQTMEQNPLNCTQLTQEHPKVDLKNGFVIDVICGTISFDISSFTKKLYSEESADEFTKVIKEKKKNSIPSFQDVLAEIAKVPTESSTQRDNDSQNKEAGTSYELLKDPSRVSNAYQSNSLTPPKGLIEILKEGEQSKSIPDFQDVLAEAAKPTSGVKLHDTEAAKESVNAALNKIKAQANKLSDAHMKLNADKIQNLLY